MAVADHAKVDFGTRYTTSTSRGAAAMRDTLLESDEMKRNTYPRGGRAPSAFSLQPDRVPPNRPSIGLLLQLSPTLKCCRPRLVRTNPPGVLRVFSLGIAALAAPGVDHLDVPRSSKRRVVLTGGTGFLGTNLLRRLVADDANVAEVHCLCIRSRPLCVRSPKIREYQGDLVKPRLGLSPADFQRLSQTADLIIHVGADVAHLKSYQMMRTANVVSTQTLLAMATPRRVPVHFVSSSSVAMLQKDPTNHLPEVPPSAFWPPADQESLMKNAIGYAASKWMGEILLEPPPAVPAVVHRFPNIMGPDAPQEIPLVALDRYCIKMRAVPALDPAQWVSQLDIIDVSDVVPDFLANAYAHDPRQSFDVHNYCSQNRYLLSDLEGMYTQKLGSRVDVLPVPEWMRRAKALGMPPGVEAIWTGSEVFISPVLCKGGKSSSASSS